MDRILCWGILLLYSFEIKGLQHVFVLRGNDLLLNVQESFELDKKADFFWKFNTKNNIAKYSSNRDAVVFDSYEGRAELFGQNYSLLLKDVKHSDSGDYTAVVFGEEDKKVAEYKVTVQDPVSPVTLTVDSVSSSSDSCNFTVTCSTTDGQISSTFICDTRSCNQLEQKSLNAGSYYSSLIVYLHEDFITCNHSNQVSQEQSKKEIRPYCETKAVPSEVFIIAALVVVGVIFVIVVIVLCIVKRGKRRNREIVPCDAPKDTSPGQTQHVSEDTSRLSPTTTYAMVEFHRGPESTEKNIPQPETVYAQVSRAAKPKSTDHEQTLSAREQATESIYRTKPV